ncbi:MAG: hypothetical protein IJF10_05075 [Clostridia bacterium]|nr:hypothetical protein [Clostridia bacterium]
MKKQNYSVLSYLFRNILYLLPVAILPAILLAISLNPYHELNLLFQHLNDTLTAENFSIYVRDIFSPVRFGEKWIVLAIGVVGFAFAESWLATNIYRHMKVGEHDFLPLKRAFSVFPMMLVYFLVFFTLLELCGLVTMGISYFLKSFANLGVAVGVTIAIYVLLESLCWLLFGLAMLCFPIMFCENYSLTSALSYSIRIMLQHKRFLVLLAFSYPVTRGLLSLVAAVCPAPVSMVLFTVFYAFLIMLLPITSFKMYFESMGMERKDVKNWLFA